MQAAMLPTKHRNPMVEMRVVELDRMMMHTWIITLQRSIGTMEDPKISDGAVSDNILRQLRDNELYGSSLVSRYDG